MNSIMLLLVVVYGGPQSLFSRHLLTEFKDSTYFRSLRKTLANTHVYGEALSVLNKFFFYNRMIINLP